MERQVTLQNVELACSGPNNGNGVTHEQHVLMNVITLTFNMDCIDYEFVTICFVYSEKSAKLGSVQVQNNNLAVGRFGGHIGDSAFNGNLNYEK